jgi:hypothetical protein
VRLTSGLQEAADAAGVALTTAQVGGMLGFFFHPGPVTSFADAQKADAEHFNSFFGAMLERGIYLAPSPFEAAFVSLAHRPADIDATLDAAVAALRKVAQIAAQIALSAARGSASMRRDAGLGLSEPGPSSPGENPRAIGDEESHGPRSP